MITKKCLLSFCTFAATLALCLAFVCVMSLFSVSKWVGVSVGGGMFVAMLIAAIVWRKNHKVYYAAICVNGVASGIAMSSLFVYLGAYPALWHIAVLFVSLCALFYLYCLLARIPFVGRHYILCMIVYGVLVAGGATVGAVLSDSAVFYLAVLCLIPFLAFFVTLGVWADDKNDNLKTCMYASFTALILALIIVLVVISEGDGLDGFAPDGASSRGKKNFRNPYDYLDGK